MQHGHWRIGMGTGICLEESSNMDAREAEGHTRDHSRDEARSRIETSALAWSIDPPYETEVNQCESRRFTSKAGCHISHMQNPLELSLTSDASTVVCQTSPSGDAGLALATDTTATSTSQLGSVCSCIAYSLRASKRLHRHYGVSTYKDGLVLNSDWVQIGSA